MPEYDTDLMSPPTAAHRMYEEAVAYHRREIERAMESGLRTNVDDPEAVARDKARREHGTPGPGFTMRPEDIDRKCGDRMCDLISRRDGRLLVFGGGSTIRMDCENCSRHEQSWALIDLRDVEDPLRTRLIETDLRAGGVGRGAPPGELPEYVCRSGCVETWIREGLTRTSEFIECLGGPPTLVRRHEVQERYEEYQDAHRRLQVDHKAAGRPEGGAFRAMLADRDLMVRLWEEASLPDGEFRPFDHEAARRLADRDVPDMNGDGSP